MRALPIIILLGIFTLYLFLTFLVSKAISGVTTSYPPKRKKILLAIFWAYSIYVLFHFIYLFIFPNTAGTSDNYKAYFFFNIVLVTDIVSRLILSLLYFISLFFGRKQPRKVIVNMGIILVAGIIITTLYGSFWGRKMLQVKEVSISFKNLPEAFDATKLAHISDFHLGSFSTHSKLPGKVVKKLDLLHPDYTLFTGDLVNNFSYELSPWQEILTETNNYPGNYAILGNHDYGDYFNWEDSLKKQQNFNGIINGVGKAGFTLLNNQSVPLTKENDTIYLIGVENWGHPPFPQYADLGEALDGIPANAFKILLTHDPAHWQSKAIKDTNIALTLSGHTHGMQWGLKPAGIEFSLIYFTRSLWGGLYHHNGQYLYVNRGLGTIGINWRIDMPPEITLITLKRGEVN